MLSTDPGALPDQAASTRVAAPVPGPPPSTGAGDAQGNAWQPAEGGPPAPPSVSLPKGGGAIRDIGEKFTVSAATGTASLTVPVATSQGRAGFGPSLSLAYDSGAGNGPFRAGVEDLLAGDHPQDRQGAAALPGRPRPGHLHPERRRGPGSRPRGTRRRWVQVRSAGPQAAGGTRSSGTGRGSRGCSPGSSAGGTLARAKPTGGRSARATSRHIYGATSDSRIADPADPARVFSWLICESYDDTGNATEYDYGAEDSAGVETGWPASATARSGPGRRAATRSGSGTATGCPTWPALVRTVIGTVIAPETRKTVNGPPAATGCSRSFSITATTTSVSRGQNLTGRGHAAPTRSPLTGRASRSAPTGAATAS